MHGTTIKKVKENPIMVLNNYKVFLWLSTTEDRNFLKYFMKILHTKWKRNLV